MIIKKIDIPIRNFAVAVSGGPDSLCLTLLASEFAIANKLDMRAIFIDHKLRPKSSEEILPIIEILNKRNIKSDVLVWEHRFSLRPLSKPSYSEEFQGAYGAENRSVLKLHEDSSTGATQKLPEERRLGERSIGGNIENKAREARYDLLTGYCHDHNIDTLLIAHHVLDQWETFMMRLSRGSGLTGLCSMRSIATKNGVNIIRPLLKYSRNDIIETLHDKFNVYEYVNDPMNDDVTYERVRFRKAYNLFANNKYGLCSESINKSIMRLQRSDDYLDKIAQKECDLMFDGLYINRNLFIQQHIEIKTRIIKKIIEKMGNRKVISYELLERAATALSASNFKAINIAGYVFRKDKTKNIKIYIENRKRKW